MEAEQLKVIAEGMGYERVALRNISAPKEYQWIALLGSEAYNPLTDNDQMVEIMDRLIHVIDLFYFEPFVDGSFKIVDVETDKIISEGKTINEAVCNAAYEYFKGEQDGIK